MQTVTLMPVCVLDAFNFVKRLSCMAFAALQKAMHGLLTISDESCF